MYPPILRQAVYSRKSKAPGAQNNSNRGRTGITVAKKLLQKNNDELKTEIATRARKFYKGVEAKPLQIDAVANLAQDWPASVQ